MNGCSQRNAYLNRRLHGTRLAEFETHLVSCDDCRTAVHSWNDTKTALTGILDDRIPNINAFSEEALIRRTLETVPAVRTHTLWKTGVGVGVGIAAAVALFLAVTVEETPPDEARGRQTVASATDNGAAPSTTPAAGVSGAAGDVLTAPDDEGLIIRLGRARFGLESQSQVKVMRADDAMIELALIRGTVGVSFPPSRDRKRGITIGVNGYRVKVVGTEFWVTGISDEEIEVGVTRGTVKVIDRNGATRELNAGSKMRTTGPKDLAVLALDPEDTSRLGALLNPEVEPAVVRGESIPARRAVQKKHRHKKDVVDSPEDESLETIRQWIVMGRLESATGALKKRLASTPGDIATLKLFAVCERKSGRPERAVEIYRRIINSGAPGEQNLARFKAGIILQDQLGRQGEAAHLFETYLQTPPAMRSNTVEARMRLARSYKTTNRHGEYKQMLETIVREHGGTEAAVKAAKSLEALR